MTKIGPFLNISGVIFLSFIDSKRYFFVTILQITKIMSLYIERRSLRWVKMFKNCLSISKRCLIFWCSTGCVAYIFKNFDPLEKSLLINVAYKTYYVSVLKNLHTIKWFHILKSQSLAQYWVRDLPEFNSKLTLKTVTRSLWLRPKGCAWPSLTDTSYSARRALVKFKIITK